ncbi:MAG: dihydroorotase [Paludibacteraceae bacterium]|nr:dihydroorotase [Paludibacteraceae bacterium]
MGRKTLIENAYILNEGCEKTGTVLIEDARIVRIYADGKEPDERTRSQAEERIDADGLYLIPGMIDAHVHFREPGMTHKGDIGTESQAAVAGGVTSYMDMPNVRPATTTMELIEEKKEIASERSLANYGFYLGITNENIEEALRADKTKVCGLKLFLGSSTGNLLMREREKVDRIMTSQLPIAVHAEDEETIESNRKRVEEFYAGKLIPMEMHAKIRSNEACVKATRYIIGEAERRGSQLHLLHISTREELQILKELREQGGGKHITAETCPQYLWFDDRDYERLGAKIKCNPAIKSKEDREALILALQDGIIDTIGTDHAPHLLSEKEGDCLHATSGTPEIEYALPMLFELSRRGLIDLSRIATLTAHHPAEIFDIRERGFIREGYFADLTLVDPNKTTEIKKERIHSKCGWSPYEGETFRARVVRTIVNGVTVYKDGTFVAPRKTPAQALEYNR